MTIQQPETNLEALLQHIDRMADEARFGLAYAIVLCFGWVVLRTGVSDWGALLRGLLAFEVPQERNGIAGATLVLLTLSVDTPSGLW